MSYAHLFKATGIVPTVPTVPIIIAGDFNLSAVSLKKGVVGKWTNKDTPKWVRDWWQTADVKLITPTEWRLLDSNTSCTAPTRQMDYMLLINPKGCDWDINVTVEPAMRHNDTSNNCCHPLVAFNLEISKKPAKSENAEESIRPLKKDTKKSKKDKDPNAPKKPLNAFMHFSRESRPKIKEDNPDATFGDIGKLLGAAWKKLSDTAKEPFEALSKADRARFDKAKAENSISKGSASSSRA
ncbi:hypothetical protein SmJEL517_g01244 [Synchytrium microbalum]|uniref:HMG box domain-containing protein n=1 Tax=Synchytrium microbalum TaxID=1806994 RepID=A0A507CEM8_9FUNG|nr:uncharacterized protein SmJEL517_g01244 [Synchytrium microbalum]TPX36486.1 hypothetical protein SmJEL517_g01244 [Synchytrium microbalum]